MRFVFILIVFSVLCYVGCSNTSNQPKEEVEEINLPEVVIVEDGEQTGLGRQRNDESKLSRLTSEQEKVAKEFAEALKQSKSKEVKKSLADAPVPMAHMQSSVPLKWTRPDDEALSFGFKEHKARGARVRNVKDKNKGKGYRLVE